MNNIKIKRFDPKTASETSWTAFHEFEDIVFKELYPEDELRSLELSKNHWQNYGKHTGLVLELVWEEKAVVAMLQLHIWEQISKERIDINIMFIKEKRSGEIENKLLEKALALAEKNNKKMFNFSSRSTIPEEEVLVKRIGAKFGIEDHINQAIIDEVDSNLLETWVKKGEEYNSGFDLLFWHNNYPEEFIDDFATLCEIMNSAPQGNLEEKDLKVDRKYLLDWLNYIENVKGDYYTCVIKEKESGKLVAFTEMTNLQDNKKIAFQWNTVVRPEFRNRGIGRWIKAAMFFKLKQVKPNVEIIRTENADVNDAMISINNEMSFKPYISVKIWQIKLDKLRDHLNGSQ